MSEEQAPVFSVDATGRLRVQVQPGGPPLPANVEAFRALASKSGYGGCFFYADEIRGLAERQSHLTEQAIIEIGERRDGTLFVSVSDDEMVAYVSITPAYGGKSITRDDVRAALRARGVVCGLLHAALDHEVDHPSGKSVVVARGSPPEAGTDAQFVSRVKKVTEKRPRIRRDGTVEFRELGQFVNVKPGDVLLLRVPETPGVAGVNVYGGPIPARAGRALEFASDLSGAAIDPQHPDRLIATAAGMPKFVENGAYVDQNLAIRDVGLATGNVYFEGDVAISGDVASGMRVVATGNVHISGTVEAAYIESAGDIVIAQGVIGRGEVLMADGSVSPTAAYLKAGRTVQARFLNNVFVEAGESVEIAEAVTHCHVRAFGEVVVGAESAKHGQIIGGRTKARDSIQAQALGSQGGVKTHIEVGADPDVVARYEELLAQADKRADELGKLAVLADELAREPKPDRPDLPDRIAKAQMRLRHELQHLKEQLEPLQKKLDAVRDARVVVARKVFSGVTILVNGKSQLTNAECGRGVFVAKQGGVVFESP